VPIYIEETARGYPDPIDWQTQGIEFYGRGKGSYVVGKDEVFYIGDPEQITLPSTGQRNKIYRMYDGRRRDHLYTKDENEKPRSYNREPRSENEYVFTLMTSSVAGSIPIYRHYSNSLKDTKLSTSASVSGYTSQGIIGYGFPSYAAAQLYRNTKIAEVAKPLFSYYSSSATDSFYTLHPNVEVNLEEYNAGPLGPPYPGDDRQDPDRGDQYAYTGILCWVFERVSGVNKERIIEVGKAQYAGSAFQYGWLTDVNGGTALGNQPTSWSTGRYAPNRLLNIQINDQRANFTFLYGEFGPVKASLPKFLGYKFLYDSQFFYYIYDTSDPWNGPLFAVRMQTDRVSLGNCCTPTQNNPCPLTDPYIYRYYYQLRPNVWKTKRSRIYTDVRNDAGEDQNILTAGTQDRILLFRYTAGSFNMVEGDTVNGWRITEHRYMGDELTTGFIRLAPVTDGVDGNNFVFGSVYSSSNTQYPASFTALAGWGIPDKCAVFGVYEFRKKVSYYKVELHPDAAIPRRTMDEAEITANVNANGKVESLNIENGGYGYSNQATVEILPPNPENTSADTKKAAAHYANSEAVSIDRDKLNYGKIGDNGDYTTVGTIVTKSLKESHTINETAIVLKPANCKITQMSEEGVIQEVAVIDGGSGYTKQDPPKVIVYDPKILSQEVKHGGDTTSSGSSLSSAVGGTNTGSPDVNALIGQSLKNPKLTNAISSAFKTFDKGVAQDVRTGYIKGVGDIDPVNTLKFCIGVPGSCIQPLFKTINPLDYYNTALFKNIIAQDTNGNFRAGYANYASQGGAAFSNLQIQADTASGLYGAITKEGIASSSCLTMAQPTLYSTRRFYDIPCAYETGAGASKKVFGWMPFQYAASKKESTKFNIYMEVDGDFTGTAGSAALNTAFMTKMKGLQAPKQLAPRAAPGNIKTWHCERGSYEGRCFRAGDGDISFYPIGLDENVYDYTHLSVDDAYFVWVGQPATTLTGTSGIGLNGRSYRWGGLGLVVLTPKYNGPNQPNTSWDHYSGPNGLFQKYSGYDGDGNGVGLQGQWDNYIYTMPVCEGITDIDSSIAFDPTVIDQNNDLVRLGPFKGTVTVKNYSTGSAKVYADAVNRLGNPYFDICLNATN